MAATSERQKADMCQSISSLSTAYEHSLMPRGRPHYRDASAYAHALANVNNLVVCRRDHSGECEHHFPEPEKTRQLRREVIMSNRLFKHLPEGLSVDFDKRGEAHFYRNGRAVPTDKLAKYFSR